MKVRIHRGAVEIGGSCVEIESSGQRILIDAGLPLDQPVKDATRIPQIDADSLRAVLISHAHLDHYGLLPWLPRTPVATGTIARKILQAAAPFLHQPRLELAGPDFVHRQQIQIGPFRITPFLVDHSAYDAYALLIEADGKRLLYSGDFRVHGRKHGLMNQMMESPPPRIDVLMLEGTSLGRRETVASPISEDDLERDFQRAFEETDGLALVQVSAQNIDRMVTIYRACRKVNRTLVIDLYAALILEATGNSRIPQSHWQHVALAIPHRQRLQVKKNVLFEALARHSIHRIYPKRHLARNPGNCVLIFRKAWMPDLEHADCLNGASLIHSQWEGYLKEPESLEVDAWRRRHGMSFHQIHTSGHASPHDLQRFAAAMRPGTLIPIHSARSELFHNLCPNVVCHKDGEWWEV
jgi:ribonuclease J